MEILTKFLESSTIHGLAYIATGRKYVRLFWTLVVVVGFTGASILIHESFQSWADSPVKTTIETLPITEITFPKVTVCPPKNTYTDLNYDLMMTENMTLDNDTRHELANYAVEMLYDHLYDNIMTKTSKLEDNERYYNWYHGYTMISLPTYHYNYQVYYNVHTTATFGTIFTQHFGEKFDVEKIHRDISYQVFVSTPDSVDNNPNITLHFKIEFIAMRNITKSSGQDCLSYLGPSGHSDCLKGDRELSLNFTQLESDEYYSMQLKRKVSLEDVRSQTLDKMPGFRLTWYYSGMKEEVETETYYSHDEKTSAFVR